MSFWLSIAGHSLGVLLLFCAVLLLTGEIVLRLFFDSTTSLTEEYAGYFCAGAIFFGAARTFALNLHIRADIIVTHLPEPLRRMTYRIAGLVTLLLTCLLLYGVGLQWMDTWTYQSRSFYPSRTPLWIPMSLPVIGLTLLFLQILVAVLNDALIPGASKSGDGINGD